MHVDDLAEACVFILRNAEAKDIYSDGVSHINIGTGQDISIADLAIVIADVAKYDGEISFDLTKPDGTLRKLLDVSRINNLGWKSKISLVEGVRSAYNWYRENRSTWEKS